jgi:CopG family nickel-responsive transcriptional regulator
MPLMNFSYRQSAVNRARLHRGVSALERVTISLEESLLADFDRYIARKGYQNRSEAVRDLVRDRLEQDRDTDDAAGFSVGSVSYVYNHHQRDLAQRLTHAQHGHHDVVLSALHVHLDHDNCLEVTLLRGPTREVRSFAETLIAETGVRHGHIHLTAVEAADAKHRHAHRHVQGDAHTHLHLKPKT